jgi:hypothetical protein
MFQAARRYRLAARRSREVEFIIRRQEIEFMFSIASIHRGWALVIKSLIEGERSRRRRYESATRTPNMHT